MEASLDPGNIDFAEGFTQAIQWIRVEVLDEFPRGHKLPSGLVVGQSYTDDDGVWTVLGDKIDAGWGACIRRRTDGVEVNVDVEFGRKLALRGRNQ